MTTKIFALNTMIFALIAFLLGFIGFKLFNERWIVHGSWHDTGHQEKFIFRSNAEKYIADNTNDFAIIELEDAWTKKTTTIVDNWDKKYGKIVTIIDRNGSFLRYEEEGKEVHLK